ncbi:MAG TPA: hypothetical protein PK198_14955 [Saprospiraceae bacterium]|nr:hypothetical protein [Saprospiraceae bacterium]HRK79797.1 hypothetical protein [Saprospiraceae bacterium]
MRFITTALFVAAIMALSFSCRQDKPDSISETIDKQSVELLCENLQDSEDAPSASVYLKTGDRKTKIAGISGQCSGINSGEYANYGMPNGTISAVGSWWAGSGDYLYAVLEGAKVVVYQGFADEMQEDAGFHYKPIVVYDGKKCTFVNTSEN